MNVVEIELQWKLRWGKPRPESVQLQQVLQDNLVDFMVNKRSVGLLNIEAILEGG